MQNCGLPGWLGDTELRTRAMRFAKDSRLGKQMNAPLYARERHRSNRREINHKNAGAAAPVRPSAAKRCAGWHRAQPPQASAVASSRCGYARQSIVAFGQGRQTAPACRDQELRCTNVGPSSRHVAAESLLPWGEPERDRKRCAVVPAMCPRHDSKPRPLRSEGAGIARPPLRVR